VEQTGTEVPYSFVSRRVTFKEKLQSLLDVYDFVVMCNRAVGDRKTVLVPMKIRPFPITKLLDEKEGVKSMIQIHKAGDNELLELVHVTLRLRSDIVAQPCHKG